MIHFAKGSDSSCSASYEPKCTFTATLNMKCFEAFAAMPKRYGAIFIWLSTNMCHIHYFVKNEKAMIQYSDRSKAVRGSPTTPGDRRPPYPLGPNTQGSAYSSPGGVNRPLMCFRRGKNLSDALVRARLPSASRPLPSTTPIVLRMAPPFRQHSTPCGTPLCKCCGVMSRAEVVYSAGRQACADHILLTTLKTMQASACT